MRAEIRSLQLAKYVPRVAAALALCSLAAPSAAQDQALYAKVREYSAQASQKLAEAKRLNISDPVGSCAAYTEVDKLLGQAITQFTACRLTYPNGPKDQMDGGMAQMVNAQRMAQSEAKGICLPTVAIKPKPAIDAPISKVNADTSREGKAKLACEADKDAEACTTYGVALMKGTATLPQNKGNAVSYFRFACNAGNALGCRNLGQAQAGGVGTMTDMAAAVISFEKGLQRRRYRFLCL